MKRATAVLAAALGLAAPAGAAHLASPESVLFHKGTIYVSLVGAFGANDGAIVTVDRSGNVTGTLAQASETARLVDPKGLAIQGTTLWVTDVTLLRSFDLATGAPGQTVDLSASARFLNDLVADRGGNLWASDSAGNALFRISSSGEVARIGLPGRFGAPNGVALHPRTGELWFVTAPGTPGQAEVVRRTAGGAFRLVKSFQAFRALDGLAFVGQTAVFSDFTTGAIWTLSPDGDLTRRARLKGGPADLAYAPALKQLLVPLLRAGHFSALAP